MTRLVNPASTEVIIPNKEGLVAERTNLEVAAHIIIKDTIRRLRAIMVGKEARRLEVNIKMVMVVDIVVQILCFAEEKNKCISFVLQRKGYNYEDLHRRTEKALGESQ